MVVTALAPATTFPHGVDPSLVVESEGSLRSQISAVYGLSVVFMVLCTFTVTLRVYTRASILRTSIGTDDWLFVATLLVFLPYGTLLCVACSLLLLHVPEYAEGQVPTGLFFPRIVVAGYCMFSAVTILFKCAFGAFFLNIFWQRRSWRVLIWLGMIVPGALGIVNIAWTAARPCELETVFFAGLPACRVGGGGDGGDGDGYRPLTGWTAVAGLWAAVSAMTDVAYATLAFLAVRGIQLPRRTRAGAVALVCLGCVGGVASCVRLAFLVAQVPGLSVLGGALYVTMWSVIEPGIAITAAAIASLRPLWTRATDPSWQRPLAAGGYAHPLGSRSAVPGFVPTVRSVGAGKHASDDDIEEAGAERIRLARVDVKPVRPPTSYGQRVKFGYF